MSITLEQARALFAAGRFDEAETAFTSLLAQQPDEVMAGLYLAQLALLSNRLEQAEQYLERYAADAPAGVPLFRELYYRQDRWAEARPFVGFSGQAGLARVLHTLEADTPYRLDGLGTGVAIPFMWRDPLPVVRARLNDQEDILLLVDTGAGDLVLDMELAERMGLPLTAAESAEFAGGLEGRLHYTPVQELRLEGLIIRHLPAQVMGVNQLLAGFFEPHGVDGIIGLHLLRQFDVQLDFAHGELRLYPPGARPIPERSGTRCWIAGDHHLVTAGRCNNEKLLWFLDTGMSGFSALVTRQVAEVAGVSPADDADAHHAYGGGGQVSVDAVAVERLCVGDICRGQHRAVVLDQFPLETRFGFHLGGALAYDFLKPFTLELDFRAMRLRLS